MTTIHLPEFVGYTMENFHQYLLLQSTIHYRITLPKETSSKYCNAEIHWEYITALFIGQELSDLSNIFSYYTPSPLIESIFQFDIETSSPLLLSKTLHRIIECLYDHTKKTFNPYLHDGATDFYIKTSDENSTPACSGLLYIAYEHFD